jgi:hypothetical protein
VKSNNAAISPNKRTGSGENKSLIKAAAADIAMAAADGPRGSLGGGQSSENSLFNKHYNKELKLCEGK